MNAAVVVSEICFEFVSSLEWIFIDTLWGKHLENNIRSSEDAAPWQYIF